MVRATTCFPDLLRSRAVCGRAQKSMSVHPSDPSRPRTPDPAIGGGRGGGGGEKQENGKCTTEAKGVGEGRGGCAHLVCEERLQHVDQVLGQQVEVQPEED